MFSSRYWPELTKSRDERRKYYPDSPEYHTCVLTFQKTIKRLLEESTNIVLKNYRISKEVFEESVNFYDSDPELKQHGENLVKPINRELPPTKLSREATKSILVYFSNKLREKNNECLDFDEYIVTTSQIEDEIYNMDRIEIEEFNYAVEKYQDHLGDIIKSMKQQTSSILASSDTSF